MVVRQIGFTLVEVMVVVVIIGTLAVMAYPYIQESLYAMESKRVESLFVHALRQARSESYIRKQDVVICTVDLQGECKRGANTTLMLFYDNNRNHQKDVNDTLIYAQNWQLRYGEILLRTSLTRDYIRYMGDTSKPRGHIGHLRYCSVSDNPRLSFKLIVNMHGHVRVERGDLVDVGCV